MKLNTTWMKAEDYQKYLEATTPIKYSTKYTFMKALRREADRFFECNTGYDGFFIKKGNDYYVGPKGDLRFRMEAKRGKFLTETICMMFDSMDEWVKKGYAKYTDSFDEVMQGKVIEFTPEFNKVVKFAEELEKQNRKVN